MFEKRLTERLMVYYNKLKPRNDLPDFRKFNSEVVGDLWHKCFTLKVQPYSENVAKTYVCEFLGEEIQKAYGKDFTGAYIDKMSHDFPGKTVIGALDKAVDEKKYQFIEGQVINQKNNIIKYRNIVLPFGKDGKVENLLVGVSYREFSS